MFSPSNLLSMATQLRNGGKAIDEDVLRIIHALAENSLAQERIINEQQKQIKHLDSVIYQLQTKVK